MKRIIIYTFLFCQVIFLNGQKADTLTEAIKQYTSAEEVLQIPASYTVLKCEIILQHKGELFKVFYAKDGSRYCLNDGSSDFKTLWKRMTEFASKGARVAIDEITVLKGNREMKWMTKTFVVH